ncbi:hypothetical protein CAPN004_23340 [Capnocytophaga cynodegmi]|nr:hypothetical protein [Capnocytophaga cynodegmi]GIM53305.1 hypothetical protein CAPN004_23340 [Capnocytophaga cynodegmi]
MQEELIPELKTHIIKAQNSDMNLNEYFKIKKGKILEKKDAITKGITAIITEKFVVKEDGIYI